jgi:hypothetical protein
VPLAERLAAEEEDFLRMAMLAAVEYLEGRGVRGARLWNRDWLPRFGEALNQLQRRPHRQDPANPAP